MAIIFNPNKKIFTLQTAHTTYQMQVDRLGYLLHLYYGAKNTCDMDYVLTYADRGFSGNPYAAGMNRTYSLDTLPQEYPTLGTGDFRNIALDIKNEHGTESVELLYKSHEIRDGKYALKGLPAVWASDDEAQTLEIVLGDDIAGVEVHLLYGVLEACDVITRSVLIKNTGSGNITIEKAHAACLDMVYGDYDVIRFYGKHAMERNLERTHLGHGTLSFGSRRGTSSHQYNPAVILAQRDTTENAGDCYGMLFVYSGNFSCEAEKDQINQTRLLMGLSDELFSYPLAAGETFTVPEVIMSYSADGFSQLSHQYHTCISEHVCRSRFAHEVRPVLINSWEAAYFDFTGDTIVDLAKEAASLGIDMVVMDDGWFAKRDDDTKSLGDWQANSKKLPGGLKGIADKIKALGMDFGIWVEPEMVNTDSDLYRSHPDWVIEIPGKAHSEGRNQRILDLTQKEVQDHIIEEMSRVFSSADISYVKWDMNRTFSDYFSQSISPERQGETAHRYVMGLYRCMKELTARFPDILFEGCAAGGNRFDLGILCYFPQIWASDDTDALCRAEIQTGYSYGYPMSVVSAHVSGCPNHQTLRTTPLETRFAVAAFGVLGYECNFCDLKKEDLEAVKAQITLYKKWRSVLQQGTFYRGRSFTGNGSADTFGKNSVLWNDDGNVTEWTCVSSDQSKAAGFVMQKLVVPNTQYGYYKPQGLCEEKEYHFYNRPLKYNVKDFGDLVNTVSPVHIRQDSIAHNLVAKFVKMDGETENITAYGDTLMYGGVKLKPAFSGNGYNENVRYFQDFGARMYFMEAVDKENIKAQ